MGKRRNVQLATKTTDKIRKRLVFPLFVQPKLNGVRCLAYMQEIDDNTLFSTSGREVILESSEGNRYRIPHIEDLLRKTIFLDNSDVVLDGELYIHDEPLNRIIRRLPKTNAKGTVSTASLPTEHLEYHMFDIKSKATQSSRLYLLMKLYNQYVKHNDYIKLVKTNTTYSLNAAELYLTDAIDKGYEGIILRYPDSLYAAGSKKIKVMLKWKRFHTGEFKVLDIISEGYKNNVFVLKMLLQNDINDATFLSNVGSSDSTDTSGKWTNRYKEEVYNNKDKYIGEQITLKWYERTGTDKELPFHSNVITFRDGNE